MDFLESTAVLIPALTGVSVTVYSGEQPVLAQFERQFCFSPKAQAIYSASRLEAFLKSCSDGLSYDLTEPLGTRLIVFRMGARWVLLGPYVEEGWNGSAARTLLVRAGASEAVVASYKAYRCKLPIAQQDRIFGAAQLTVGHMNGCGPREIREIRTQAGGGDALAYPSDYGDSAVVNRRYAIEGRFIAAIKQGGRRCGKEIFQGI